MYKMRSDLCTATAVYHNLPVQHHHPTDRDRCPRMASGRPTSATRRPRMQQQICRLFRLERSGCGPDIVDVAVAVAARHLHHLRSAMLGSCVIRAGGDTIPFVLKTPMQRRGSLMCISIYRAAGCRPLCPPLFFCSAPG